MDDAKKFGRWDRVQYRWRAPTDDSRPESKRIGEDSLQITGHLKKSERDAFLERAIVQSLKRERSEGRSLALIKPEFLDFLVERKSDDDLAKEQVKFEEVQRQADLFAKSIAAYKPCPYKFQYKYRIEDGERTGRCQDWEIEATFFRHGQLYGEQNALSFIQRRFGEEYPRQGMLFAMGTHSLYPDTWLLNGVLRYNEPNQISLL